jgi:thiamine pyrophosphokinase
MEKIIENLYVYKSILCLNGALQLDIIKKFELPIVAADGAANTLIRNGIEPRIIVGDLDSVDEKLLINREYVQIADQNSTDFEKALDFIEKEHLSPAIVTGIDGGYIDHMLGNISVFSSTNFVAVSDNVVFTTICDEKNFRIPIDTKISIFGIPTCIIKSTGLKWELDKNELSIVGQNSISNRSTSTQVKLEVMSGRAMVFIYTDKICDAGRDCVV